MSAVSTLAGLRVADAMSSGVITCGASWSLGQVAGVMAANRVHCVVIPNLSEHGHLTERWGVVSDADLISALTGGDVAVTAGEIAATDPVTVHAREPLDRACQLMAEHGVSHVLVVEHVSSWPVGVVSSLDVARAVAELVTPTAR